MNQSSLPNCSKQSRDSHTSDTCRADAFGFYGSSIDEAITAISSIALLRLVRCGSNMASLERLGLGMPKFGMATINDPTVVVDLNHRAEQWAP
jgi:hypothetical protein